MCRGGSWHLHGCGTSTAQVGDCIYIICNSFEDGRSALMIACGNGHYEIAKLLLVWGAEVDLQDDSGRSALFFASIMGHSKLVELLVEKGAQVNLLDNAGFSPLMFARDNWLDEIDRAVDIDHFHDNLSEFVSASLSRHLVVSKLLLDNGAAIDLEDKDGGRALLLLACASGSLDIVRSILDKEPWMCTSVRYVGLAGEALVMACTFGHYKIVSLLLDKGFPLNYGSCSAISLWYACRRGHYEVAKLLLERGAQVDLMDEDGMSPLLHACARGECEVVKLLLQLGAHVNLVNSDGLSPLMSASREGNFEVVKLLLDKGAHVNLQDNLQMSSLMYASKYGHLKVVRLLLERDFEGAILAACKGGHSEALKMLLGHCSHQMSADILQEACIKGKFGIVTMLLEHGAPLSALMSASTEGNLDVVNKGAQINLQNYYFKSSLMYASRHGHLEAVKLLIRNGAKVDFLNTALKLASDHGHTDIVKFLTDPNEVSQTTLAPWRGIHLYSHPLQVLWQSHDSHQPSQPQSDKLISGGKL